MLVALLVIAGSVVSFKVSTLAASLAALVGYSQTIEQHAKASDLDALADDIVHLDDLAQDALIAASDPVVSATRGAPFVGDYLSAARSIASAAVSLTTVARPLSALLPRLDPDSVVNDGHYDVDALRDLDTGLSELSAAIDESRAQLDGIDRTGLDARVGSAIDSVDGALGDAKGLFATAQPFIAMLPVVLGTDGTWFVALQNLAEARATGGLLGAYSVLSIDGGKVTQTGGGSDADLIPVPVKTTGIASDYLDIWGSQLGEWRRINNSPNFPDTGQLIANVWNSKSGQAVDGVLSFGQGIVPYLLAATGPIDVDGSTVDATNAVQFLSLDVYAKYPDATDKNAIVAQLMQEIFSRLQDGQFDIESLLDVASATETHDRIQLWSPHDDVEAQIASLGLDGTLGDAYGPDAYVAINNGGGNKLDQFLDVSVDYELGQCNPTSEWSEERTSTISVTLTNNAPTSGLPNYVNPRSDLEAQGIPYTRGSNNDVVSVYAPVGSYENETTLDGEVIPAYAGEERDRPLYVAEMDLEPGQSSTLTISWNEPTVGDEITDVLSAQPTVQFSPSLRPWVATAPAAPLCP